MTVDARDRGPEPARHPLAGALDAAESWPEAAAYEVPVPQVRRLVHRRRTARRAGLAGGVCAVVAGVVVAWPGVSGLWSATSPSGLRPQGDWAAQFDRCGEPFVAPAHATVLRLQDASIDAGATWRATTLSDQPDGNANTLVGTDVSLVRDGVVVAVQDGPQVQQPDGPTTVEGLTHAYGASAIFPVEAHLVSCAPFTGRAGSSVVAPGTYELVVVQTLAMTSIDGSTADWTQHAVAHTTVTVPGPAQPDVPRCAEADDALVTLAHDGRLQVELAQPVADAVGGKALSLPIRLTNTGPSRLHGSVGVPSLYVTRDGVVVAVASSVGDGMASGVDLPRNASQDGGYGDLTLDRCAAGQTSTPLAVGDYQLWASVPFDDYPLPGPQGGPGTGTPGRAPTDVAFTAVGGPWPLTIR